MLPRYRPKLVTKESYAAKLAEYDGSAHLARCSQKIVETAAYARMRRRIELEDAMADLDLPAVIGNRLDR